MRVPYKPDRSRGMPRTVSVDRLVKKLFASLANQQACFLLCLSMHAAKPCGGGYDHYWRKAEEADGMPRRMYFMGK